MTLKFGFAHITTLSWGKAKEILFTFLRISWKAEPTNKENLSRRIVERLNEMFPAISILSINIGEFEKATYSNKALIHPLNMTSDRHLKVEN